MTNLSLTDLGWSDHFAHQKTAQPTAMPARVTDVHRDRLDVLGTEGPLTLVSGQLTGAYAVGDWVYHDGRQVCQVLDRKTAIGRGAAGETGGHQLIAANVDTLAIVTSCNDDFNPARLERYLAMCSAGGALPLVVLTKADLTPDADGFRRRAEKLSPLVSAVTLNACDAEDVARLYPWCTAGQTMALVGSSGVGKTTLQNALTGTAQLTQSIREADAKGRHTTTARSLRRTLVGGWLIDTPGMRELRLSQAREGIDAVFADLALLAQQCQFNDCQHAGEPGCAVQAAIKDGSLEQARLQRWQKLRREDAYFNRSAAELRAEKSSWKKRSKNARAQSKTKNNSWGS